MRLALTGLFRARWTEKIHDEWSSALLASRPDLTADQLRRTRDLMNENVCDCLVEEYEDLIPGLQLPDDNDRHVLAAAIKCSASVIVTLNLKHFPHSHTGKYGIEAQHPDDFITHQIDLSPGKVCSAVRDQRLALKNPVKSVEELLDTLAGCQLTESTLRLAEFKDLI